MARSQKTPEENQKWPHTKNRKRESRKKSKKITEPSQTITTNQNTQLGLVTGTSDPSPRQVRTHKKAKRKSPPIEGLQPGGIINPYSSNVTANKQRQRTVILSLNVDSLLNDKETLEM